jgi:hypothetical protein
MSNSELPTAALFQSFSEAHGRGDYVSATERFLEALAGDPDGAFRYFVFQASGNFVTALNRGGRRQEVVERLDAMLANHPHLHYLCEPPTAERLREVVAWREAKIDQGLPSVVFVPQGKSASESVAQIFHGGFGLPAVCYSLVMMDVIDSWAADYARGGACYSTHLNPSIEKVTKLKKAGIDRIIVHVRDPRQALISLIHHFDAYPDQMRELRTRAAGCTISDRAKNVLHAYRGSIQWISGWVDAAEHIDIMFSTYEQFVRDKDMLVEQYLEFYGGDRRQFSYERALEQCEGKDYHFRSGKTDEWREVLDPALADKLSALLPERIKDKFGWAD